MIFSSWFHVTAFLGFLPGYLVLAQDNSSVLFFLDRTQYYLDCSVLIPKFPNDTEGIELPTTFSTAAFGIYHLPWTGEYGTCEIKVDFKPDALEDTSSWHDIKEKLKEMNRHCFQQRVSRNTAFFGANEDIVLRLRPVISSIRGLKLSAKYDRILDVVARTWKG